MNTSVVGVAHDEFPGLSMNRIQVPNDLLDKLAAALEAHEQTIALARELAGMSPMWPQATRTTIDRDLYASAIVALRQLPNRPKWGPADHLARQARDLLPGWYLRTRPELL